MRHPSIHIRVSDLVDELPKIKEAMDNDISRADLKKLIMNLMSPHAIKNRSIFKVSATRKKKIDRVMKAKTENVGRFQTILVNYRKSLNHKRVTLVNMGDSNYGLLKEIVDIADEFAETFNLDKEFAYTEYVKRFFELLGRAQFGLNKLKFYKDKIFDAYEAVELMKEDLTKPDNKENTVEFFKVWSELMGKYTGGDTGKLDNDDEFIHMVLGRQEADSLGAGYEDYLEAQFEKLASFDFIPEFGALYGPKARGRYKSYMATVDKSDKSEIMLTKNLSEEEKRYMEIRDRKSV